MNKTFIFLYAMILSAAVLSANNNGNNSQSAYSYQAQRYLQEFYPNGNTPNPEFHSSYPYKQYGFPNTLNPYSSNPSIDEEQYENSYSDYPNFDDGFNNTNPY